MCWEDRWEVRRRGEKRCLKEVEVWYVNHGGRPKMGEKTLTCYSLSICIVGQVVHIRLWHDNL